MTRTRSRCGVGQNTIHRFLLTVQYRPLLIIFQNTADDFVGWWKKEVVKQQEQCREGQGAEPESGFLLAKQCVNENALGKRGCAKSPYSPDPSIALV